MIIGETIRKLREKENITQQELAEGIGATQGYIAQIERGTKVLSFPMAVKVAEYFNITLEELAG